MAAYDGENTYSGAGATGIYKDIKDKLFYIEGNDTPIQDMAGYTKAKGKTHYWESVAYTVNTSNTEQRTEGATLTNDTPPSQTEWYNYTEINSETYGISTSSISVAKNGGKAGSKNELTRNKRDAMVELKGKFEASLLNGVKASGENTTAPVARKMDGLVTMAKAAVTAYNTNVSGGESTFRTALIAQYTAGGLRGKKKILYTSYTNKDLISDNWKGMATDVNVMAKDSYVYADAKIYSSQYGNIVMKGHPSFADDTDIVVFNQEDLNIAWLTKTNSVPLAKTGLSTQFSINNEACLEYVRPGTLLHIEIS